MLTDLTNKIKMVLNVNVVININYTEGNRLERYLPCRKL